MKAFRVLCVIGLGVCAGGCGRIGFDLLPLEPGGGSGAATVHDAGIDGEGTGGEGTGGTATVTDGSAGGAGGQGGAPMTNCTGLVEHVDDACASLPELPTPPVIDGLPDCAVATTLLESLGWAEPDGGAPDAVARYAVAARPDGLYVYVVVTDASAVPAAPGDPVDTGDAVEVFVDSDGTFTSPPAYDDPGTRRFVIAAPSFGASVSTRGEVWAGRSAAPAKWTSSEFQATSRSFGYVVEAFIRAEDLGVPSVDFTAGRELGWNLAIDVSFATESTTGADGHRLGRYFLHLGPSDTTAIDDVRALCTPSVL